MDIVDNTHWTFGVIDELGLDDLVCLYRGWAKSMPMARAVKSFLGVKSSRAVIEPPRDVTPKVVSEEEFQALLAESHSFEHANFKR